MNVKAHDRHPGYTNGGISEGRDSRGQPLKPGAKLDNRMDPANALKRQKSGSGGKGMRGDMEENG